MKWERLLLFLIPFLVACSSMNTARPLKQGQHAVGLTMGGPLVEFGGNYIPVPNMVLEGRSGLKPIKSKPLDVNYGINLTAIVFDQIGVHGGSTYLLSRQDGKRPAWSISDRLYLYSNHISTDTHADGKGFCH